MKTASAPIFILTAAALMGGCRPSQKEGGRVFVYGRPEPTPGVPQTQELPLPESAYDFSETQNEYGSFEFRTIKQSEFRRETVARSISLEPVAAQKNAFLINGLNQPGLSLLIPEIRLRRGEGHFQLKLSTDSSQFLRAHPGLTLLGSLPCPVSIGFEGESKKLYKLKFKLKSCPLNVFLPLEIENFQKYALDDLEKLVAVNFELGIPVLTQSLELKLDPKKIKTEFEGLQNIARESIEVQISKVVKKISNLLNGRLTFELESQCEREFFDSLFQVSSAPNNQPLYSFKNSNAPILMSLRTEEFFGNSVKFESKNYLIDAFSERYPITIKQESLDESVPPATDVINNALLTARPGDWLELKLNKFSKSSYSLRNNEVTNISETVCPKTKFMCEEGTWSCNNPEQEEPYNCRQECTGGTDRRCTAYGVGVGGACICVKWVDTCRSTSEVCDHRRVCSALSPPPKPSLPYDVNEFTPIDASFTWSCTKQAVPTCNESELETRWFRVTKYSNPFPVAQLQNVAITSELMEKLINGLSITSGGESCPLSLFEIKKIGVDRILFRIKSNGYCSFNSESVLSLGLINAFHFKESYNCGSMREGPNGERQYVCPISNGKVVERLSSQKQDQELVSLGLKPGIQNEFYPKTMIDAEIGVIKTEEEENEK